MNLTLGLKGAGCSVAVCAASVSQVASAALNRQGIRLRSLNQNLNTARFRATLLLGVSRNWKILATEANRLPRTDWTIVIGDDCLPVIESLRRNRSIFICNGDPALLLASPSFVRQKAVARRAASVGVAERIRRHAALASRFNLLFANSEFTRQFMSYLYALPFDEVVYPPVDRSVMFPRRTPGASRFVICLARNDNEQNLDLIKRLARDLPVRVVGGASVPGATNMGRVSDEELSTLYSNADFLFYPAVSEFYGYAVAEALSCGTPALVLSTGGPAEMIRDGVNGWIARGTDELVSRARQLFKEGYDPRIREEALKSSLGYSIEYVTSRFLRDLSELGADVPLQPTQPGA